jgi:hypothetical protein
MNSTIADVLVLVFTPGVSLRSWESSGMLEREWALYRAIRGRFGRVVLATFGGADDATIAARLDGSPEVIVNSGGLDQTSYIGLLPSLVAEAVGASSLRVVVKTNQMAAGRAAVGIAGALKAAGHRVGLVARGGYHWSRFEAYHHGAGSGACRDAAKIEEELCNAAGVVVGTTQSMLDDLSWRMHLAPERVRLIPNYVVPEASDGPAGGAAREAGLILCAGQLVLRKRVHLIIEAMAFLPEELRAQVRLLVVGEGPEETRLRELASKNGANVEFRPRVPHAELMGLMSTCTVFAQASDYEGHPKTIIEAMSRQAPVLVCEAPGVSELIRNGINGLRVDADPATIGEALSQLLQDQDWQRSMGAEASVWASSQFALERIVPLELAAYEAALARETTARDGGPMVRFDPELLHAGPAQATKVFGGCIAAFTRKLAPREQAEFLMRLDTRLYWLHGETAIAANHGLHPKHHVMNYHDFFTARLGPTDTVIDLGCGVGALGGSIATRSGARVTGMEISEPTLEKARTRASQLAGGPNIQFIRGDITTDRAPGTYSAVVLSNVLEHLQNRVELLKQWQAWYGATKFLIRVPALDRDWRVAWKKELGVEWRLDETHETEYTRDQLLAELDQAGLVVRELIANWGEYWVVAEVRNPGAAGAIHAA